MVDLKEKDSQRDCEYCDNFHFNNAFKDIDEFESDYKLIYLEELD